MNEFSPRRILEMKICFRKESKVMQFFSANLYKRSLVINKIKIIGALKAIESI